jgi:hypothetical protein
VVAEVAEVQAEAAAAVQPWQVVSQVLAVQVRVYQEFLQVELAEQAKVGVVAVQV